jgi:Domain of unknown function (DUF4333)
MNDSRQPGRGNEPGPDAPWYLHRPTSDDDTSIARQRPIPPRAAPPTPPPRYRRPPGGHRPPPPPPEIPWYLQRPDRPPPPTAERQQPTADTKSTQAPDRSNLIRWLLVGAGGLALVVGIAVLVINIPKLGTAGGTVLDVSRVQAGVLQTLSDPASGYGANTVTDVSCNNGRNPSAGKGTTFICDATVNGDQRHVTVIVSDDSGTYEIDGPR